MDVSGSPSQSPVRPRRKTAPGPKPDATPAPRGTRFGRYVVTGLLGRGGMGVVYEAEDTRLQRRVAIKLLSEEVSSDADALARFLREAQVAAKLNHANVVAVYDIGEAGGKHYIVMELVNGGSAQDALRARGPFDWQEATAVVMDVCRGVAAAHKAGLIHRDIKPANILRSADGVVKLSDFGLAKPTNRKDTDVTGLGETVGTPHYMSPEQSRSKPLDRRSDIYSLGATYFALLTGRPPFNSPDSMQVLMAHCANPVPDPRELVPDVPEACTAIINKAMAKSRAQRYPTASDLLADLQKLLAPTSPEPSATPRGAWGAKKTDDTDPLSFADAYPGERSEKAPRPNRRRLIALGVLGAVGLGLGVFRRRNPEAEREPQQFPSTVSDDWATRLAEAEKAVRARNATAIRRELENVRVVQNRPQHQEPARQEAIRQTLVRLEKALAFRTSITERGLVVGLDGPVTSTVISPDDRLLAVGQWHGDAGAIVFDSYTGEKRYSLWPRRGQTLVRVQALSFDRDSARLAAASTDNKIRVLHVATGQETLVNPGTGVKRVQAVAFSPSAPNLVGGFETFGEGKGKPYLKVWNLNASKEPFPFKAEHSSHVAAVAFTAGGHQVATGSTDARVVLWNADTGRIWRELRCGVPVRVVACGPQGRTAVVSGGDPEKPVIQFWDYAGDKLLATETSPHGPCQCLAFSRDGALVAAGSGSRVLLWNPETRALVATLSGHSQVVNSVTFTAEGGVLVTGSADQTARLWDVSRYLPRAEP